MNNCCFQKFSIHRWFQNKKHNKIVPVTGGEPCLSPVVYIMNYPDNKKIYPVSARGKYFKKQQAIRRREHEKYMLYIRRMKRIMRFIKIFYFLKYIR